MRLFKTSQFVRHALCQRLTDAELWDATTRAQDPDLDIDLGNGLRRQRIRRSITRRRRGYCAILSCRSEGLGFILYAFPRKGIDDLSHSESAAYRGLVQHLLALKEDSINFLITKGSLIEVRPS